MFNKEKSPSSPEKPTSNNSSATLISAGTILTGDVLSETDLRIDGTIKGNVKSTAKIIVGSTGFVDGNIQGAHADIIGKVKGNIVVSELLQLRGQSNINGNITAGKLQIEPTAVFNGQCVMGAPATAASAVTSNAAKSNIVQMSKDVAPAAESK